MADAEGSAGPHWKKSSWSSHAGNCVEVAALPEGVIGVRDSKETGADRVVLAFSCADWDCFLTGVRAGEFDL
jgi:hypothetical protein